MKNLNYLIDHTLSEISKIEYVFKKHGEKTVDPSIKVYVNKIENRITLKLKQLLSPTFNS